MKKFYKLMSIIVSALLLSSCTLHINYSVYTVPKISISPLEPIEKGTSRMSTYQYYSSKGLGVSYLPSLGEPNILVIPIEFVDYPFSRYGDSDDQVKERINDAFFTSRSYNELVESVSSFYQTSSYGDLKIKGSVTDIITAPKTMSYYSSITSSRSQLKEIESLINTTLKSYDDTTDFTIYDTDSNNYFDGIWLVYSAPYNTQNIFWAFTTWTDMKNKYDGIQVSNYAWASYQFFDSGGYTSHPDAHTFIHETGHLLGLDDFYSYDSSIYSPVGCLDMMDYNIGDHMAFSKYNLGWIEPTVLTESQTIELTPISSTRSAAIIPAPNYNNTPFWEYFIFEFYTPNFLNRIDSQRDYENSGIYMFNIPGLRVYHVNQKFGLLDTKTGTIIGDPITDLSTTLNNNNYVVINSNSSSLSYNANSSVRLVTLNCKKHGIHITGKATNEALYVNGDNGSLYSDRWEDFTLTRYSFSVDSLTLAKITISFTIN